MRGGQPEFQPSMVALPAEPSADEKARHELTRYPSAPWCIRCIVQRHSASQSLSRCHSTAGPSLAPRGLLLYQDQRGRHRRGRAVRHHARSCRQGGHALRHGVRRELQRPLRPDQGHVKHIWRSIHYQLGREGQGQARARHHLAAGHEAQLSLHGSRRACALGDPRPDSDDEIPGHWSLPGRRARPRSPHPPLDYQTRELAYDPLPRQGDGRDRLRRRLRRGVSQGDRSLRRSQHDQDPRARPPRDTTRSPSTQGRHHVDARHLAWAQRGHRRAPRRYSKRLDKEPNDSQTLSMQPRRPHLVQIGAVRALGRRQRWSREARQTDQDAARGLHARAFRRARRGGGELTFGQSHQKYLPAPSPWMRSRRLQTQVAQRAPLHQPRRQQGRHLRRRQHLQRRDRNLRPSSPADSRRTSALVWPPRCCTNQCGPSMRRRTSVTITSITRKAASTPRCWPRPRRELCCN